MIFLTDTGGEGGQVDVPGVHTLQQLHPQVLWRLQRSQPRQIGRGA